MRRYTRWTLLRELLLILLAIVWMIPFYFLVIVSDDPDVEALQSPLSFPDGSTSPASVPPGTTPRSTARC